MGNEQYRPGILKLLHHQEHLAKIEKGEVVGPIHLSVFPNNFCQLECEYCCFSKTIRDKKELDLTDFITAITVLKIYGLKAVELSGGGDPLLWSHFSDAVDYAHDIGLKLSLVTNGLAIKNISPDILSKFNWIRISIQSVAYAKKLNLRNIKDIKTSMSYIVHDNKSFAEIEKLYHYAVENNVIIRVTSIRPCTPEFEQRVYDEVQKYGEPLIMFKKEYGSPPGCYMLWIRAALDWQGNFLPCPSIELSPEYAGKIPENFGVCKVGGIDEYLRNNKPHNLGWNCSFCNCGRDSNELIHNLLQEIDDVDFV